MKSTNNTISELFNKLLKETSLESRLKVSNETAFINLLTELGFREDKYWSDEENHILEKLCKLAKEHTDNQLETIKSCKNDGEPT